jgi:CBS domain-containing protein
MNQIQSEHIVKASDIMTKPVEVVRAVDSLHDVARLFNEKHIGAAAVLDGVGKPVGVITKTDLIRYEEEKNDVGTVDKRNLPRFDADLKRPGFHLVDDDDTVQNWMTPVIFTVKPETSMKELAQRMVRYGIHHIFVQKPNQTGLLGIVSSFDVLRTVADVSR